MVTVGFGVTTVSEFGSVVEVVEVEVVEEVVSGLASVVDVVLTVPAVVVVTWSVEGCSITCWTSGEPPLGKLIPTLAAVSDIRC